MWLILKTGWSQINFDVLWLNVLPFTILLYCDINVQHSGSPFRWWITEQESEYLYAWSNEHINTENELLNSSHSDRTLLLWSTFCDVYHYHLLKYKTQSQRATTHKRTKICYLARQRDCWDFKSEFLPISLENAPSESFSDSWNRTRPISILSRARGLAATEAAILQMMAAAAWMEPGARIAVSVYNISSLE